MHAAEKGRYAVVSLLLQYKAQIDLVDRVSAILPLRSSYVIAVQRAHYMGHAMFCLHLHTYGDYSNVIKALCDECLMP